MNYQINQTIMIRKEMVVYKGRGLTDVKQLKVFFCLFVCLHNNELAGFRKRRNKIYILNNLKHVTAIRSFHIKMRVFAL